MQQARGQQAQQVLDNQAPQRVALGQQQRVTLADLEQVQVEVPDEHLLCLIWAT